MLGYLRKYRALDKQRRSLLWRAWFALGTARIALMRSPLKGLTRALKRRDGAFQSPELEPTSAALAHAVGWAVRTAAVATPWASTCLVQVFAAQRMLQRRGIPGAFYIGACPGEGRLGERELEAHAWLMCGPEYITGEIGDVPYTALSAFSWPATPGEAQPR